MDIDKTNFKDHYKQLMSLISSCDFLAFDCEFSGISTEHFQKITKYDSDEDIYQKMKHTVQNYHLLQIGICVYTFCAVQKKYVAHPFNVYLNPNYLNTSSVKKQMIQLECYNFMADNGLDFNRIYTKGLPYIKLSERESLLKPKKERQEGMGLSPSNTLHMNRILKELKEFEENIKLKELIIDAHSPYLVSKILKHQIHEEEFHGKNVTVERAPLETQILVRRKKVAVTMVDPATINATSSSKESEKPAIELEVTGGDSTTIDEVDLLGFTLIVQQIIKSKRPIIGHYMGLDLFYFFDHFIDHLPNSYLEFVQKIQEVFPYTIDTKVIAKKLQNRIKRLPLHLEGLYKSVAYDEKTLKKFHNTVLTEDPAFSKYSLTGQLHEAGFDAYMTGAAFIGMCYFEKYEAEIAVQLSGVQQVTKKGKVTDEFKDKSDKIYATLMQTFFDPRFPASNLNRIYLRSGGVFHLDFATESARKAEEVQHANAFLANTVYFEYDDSSLEFSDVLAHFTKHGDVAVSIVDKGIGYVEYEQFEIFEGIEDKIGHILPLLNTPKFTVLKYTERRRFRAFSYFK